jgi:hypothetical protein
MRSTNTPIPDLSNRQWQEYRVVKHFLADDVPLRVAAKELGVSPSAFAFTVCKHAPVIHKRLQIITATGHDMRAADSSQTEGRNTSPSAPTSEGSRGGGDV